MNNDLIFMSQAIQLARKGWYTTQPNPRVGCVLVKNNRIIGQGWHQQAGQAHAEINAIKQVIDKAELKGATAYVTLEPCSHFGKTPPCCNALIDAGIARVVIAMEDPNPLVAGQGIKELENAGIKVLVGSLNAEAITLNRGFIKRMVDNKPFIRCKMAASLDGQTALSSGESQWITSTQARLDVQRLRAESSAIVTGIGTVLADDPSMTVRNASYPIIQQPDRVIIDSQLRIPLTAKILKPPGQVHICVADKIVSKNSKYKKLIQSGVNIHKLEHISGIGLNLHQLIDLLAKLNFNEVLVESGKTLAGAMITASLVDELIIYLAPKLMGSNGRGMFDLAGIETMKDCMQLQLKDTRLIGGDIRLSFDLS